MGYKEEALNFLGITRWHELGYTGKGIKIMSDERVYNKVHPDVISPKGFSSSRSHGDEVMIHMKMVAPDATLIAYNFSGTFGSNSYKCDCADYIQSENVNIFTTSCSGDYPNAGKRKAMEDCLATGCIFFGAAGNDNKKGVKGEIQYEGYLAIGGVKPKYNTKTKKYEWDELTKTNYSSVGKELDYVTIAEILGVSGTSFCSPVFACMCGLVQQFFIEKTGRQLLRKELELFIHDNLIDVDVEGFDNNTGYGIFILPEPFTIDIKKYCPEYTENSKEETKLEIKEENTNENVESEEIINTNKTIIKLYIGNKNITVNNKQITSDVAPFIKDGRTMVPLRVISEIFGYNVEWNGTTQEVKITSDIEVN